MKTNGEKLSENGSTHTNRIAIKHIAQLRELRSLKPEFAQSESTGISETRQPGQREREGRPVLSCVVRTGRGERLAVPSGKARADLLRPVKE